MGLSLGLRRSGVTPTSRRRDVPGSPGGAATCQYLALRASSSAFSLPEHAGFGAAIALPSDSPGFLSPQERVDEGLIGFAGGRRAERSPGGLHQQASSSPFLQPSTGGPLPLRLVSMTKCLPPKRLENFFAVLDLGFGRLVVRHVQREAVRLLDPGLLQAARRSRAPAASPNGRRRCTRPCSEGHELVDGKSEQLQAALSGPLARGTS